MKRENRGGTPLAGLIVAAILLTSMAGYVSAFSRAFQVPYLWQAAWEGDLQFNDRYGIRAEEERAARPLQSLARTASAWSLNTFQRYSSSVSDVAYFSLKRSGDRVSFEQPSSLNAPASGTYTAVDPKLSDKLTPAPVFVHSLVIKPPEPSVNTANTYTGSTTGNVLTGTNWGLGHVPTVSEDAVFNNGTGIRTFNNGSLTVGSWNVTAGGTYTLRNATAATTSTLTLGGAGSTGNGVSGTATDLLFVTTGSTFTITGVNVSTAILNVVLGQSGDFDAAGTMNVSSVISDGGNNFAITKTGAGTLSLSGANTYGGGLTLSTGTLGINNAAAPGTGTFTINGGTITNTSGGAITLSNNNAQIWGGDFTFAGTTGTNSLNLGTGTVTLTANRQITVSGTTSTLTVGGSIIDGAGATNLTKTSSGLGTLIFAGTTANTYSGTTTINGGELDLNKTAGVNAIAGNIVIGDGGGVDTLKLLASDQIANTSDMTINSNGVFNLNNNSETIDALNGSAGASLLLGSGTLTVGANNETIFTYAGSSSGTGGLTKAGSGILLLSGSNAYTGSTTIKGGELFLTPSGSLASGSVIHLGDTIPNSPSAMFTFGSTTGGVTLSNSMIVEASASGSEGTRTLLGLAESGATNTWAGTITLNTDLTVQSAAAGGSVVNGPGILLFQGGSIDVKDNVFMMNSNLRGNNADTYSIQGTVIVNEVLGSSFATGGSVVKDGSGTLILQGTSNTYTGTDASNLNAAGTTIRGGVLGIFGDGSLGLAPTNANNNVFFDNSAFNTNGDSIGPTLRADAAGITLATTRNINIAGGVTARFDSNGNTFTIAGNINGANGNLNKIGPGTLVLAGANTYTGSTTISQGVLNASVTGALGGTTGSITVNNGGTLMVSGTGNLNRINDTTPIVLGAGTGANPIFERNGSGVVSEGTGAQRTGPGPLDVTGTSSVGLGALSLQSNATFNFGTGGVGTFTFASFAPGTFTLNVLNWTSSNADFTASMSGIDGIDDRLIFAGVLPPDTAFITFNGNQSTALLLEPGFWEVMPLTAVPEPSTWIGGALALAAIGFMSRKRFAKRSRVIG